MNQGVLGSLLDETPYMSRACDLRCVNGIPDCYDDRFYPDGHTPSNRREANSSYDLIGLESIQNKGPLLTTAMALFGRGSFPQTRLANPKAYITTHPATASQPRRRVGLEHLIHSFAMMRVGAVYGSHFPLHIDSGIHDVEEVHQRSGTVGAVDGDEGSARRLEPGARGMIESGKYLRYN